MTEEELCNLVLEQTGMSETALPRFRILGLSKDARMELAHQIAAGSLEHRQLTRKTFAGTTGVSTDANGVADLTPLVTAVEPLLIKEFWTTEIYVAGMERRLQLVADHTAVKWDRPDGWPFGALQETNLLVYNEGKPVPTAALTITGAYVPSLEHLKPELNHPLVLIIQAMVTGAVPSPQRTATQEAKATVE